ncbi:hypothetical protein [Acetobacter ghanensis]|uniref:Uncharacterized protein n=1 Tax=Acetobacter ghanensis TaxID=431306 RepID=A0A0U4YB22_9PROT|nr:hypothetical protein [Acetobacter ghanensis]NHO39612.1 hypothetical protein [Acetobacter ghanensis]GBQ45921.1 hypothetical protein AA18895_0615 [Acetobacter ghanensis DSM 18895]CEF54877.1 hypothetical protein AGA_1027 [Acetobacter ghanensis]
MKRFFALCILLPGLDAATFHHTAAAQTVLDNSAQKASPFVKATLKTLTERFSTAHPKFRNLAVHTNSDKKQVVCGQVSLSENKAPAEESFMSFGAAEDSEQPVVYEARTIPATLDSREANQWINHGADLEELEELGCVPEGSYRQYGDTLNKVLQDHKINTTR